MNSRVQVNYNYTNYYFLEIFLESRLSYGLKIDFGFFNWEEYRLVVGNGTVGRGQGLSAVRDSSSKTGER